MKYLLLLISLFGGFCLLACTPATEPISVTRPSTSVTATTAVPTQTTIPPTFTPIATFLPNATATPIASPTNPPPPTATATMWPTAPTPTWTPTAVPPTPIPSPTPVTVLLTPIEQIATGQTLPLNNELLFLTENELKLWQPTTGDVTTLLTSTNTNLTIMEWKTTPDKQTILIAQTGDDEVPGFTLSLFEAGTKQMEMLWSESEQYLLAYALAPNGRSAAIITSATSPRSREDQGIQDIISVINREDRQITPLTNCPNARPEANFTYINRCQTIVSTPDNQSWLWRDIEGVWQGNLEQTPRLLLAHDYFDNDPPRIYHPTDDWSPNGRYQLLLARRFKGRTRWVFDINTQQIMEVPNSIVGLDRLSYWQWTQDNHLFGVRQPNRRDDEADHIAELWRVADGQLLLDASLALFPSPVAEPAPLTDGRFALLINSDQPDKPEARNLYLLTDLQQPLQTVVSLPPLDDRYGTYGQSIQWLPDNSGALYRLPTRETDRTFYIPAEGAVLYEVTALLGPDIADFLWLP